MRRRMKGFTLIELIVVIAIIGVLAAILIPAMLGYVKNARVSEYNGNAKIVFNSAQSTIAEGIADGALMLQASAVYIGSADGTATSGGDELDLTEYLGSSYSGYFAFMIDSSGCGCSYALWSERPISASDVAQMTTQDVEDSFDTALPMGCYPLLDEANNDGN